MVNFIKQWAWQGFAILFLLLFLGKGCTKTKISKTNKKLESNNSILVNRVDSLVTEIIELNKVTVKSDQLENIMERVMLNYLIYEDDLDRGKISLSQIKDKIEAND